jgi:GT2 family glycosyltransferase
MVLSILVLNYKNPPLLRLCLKSLITTISRNLDYEILVIDSESTPETQNVVTEEFPTVKLITYRENIGYTKGINEGIKNASGDYYLVLNPDIIPLENSIEKLLNHLQKNEDTGLIGPKLLNFDGSRQDSCYKFYTPFIIAYRRTFLGKLPWAKKSLDKFLMKDIDLSYVSKVDWLMGSAVMASKKAVKKNGLMDEKLFLYMSDVDWARRFWENGYKVIYFPEAEMYHYHRRGSKGRLSMFDVFFNKETRLHIIDAFKYFKKYGWIYKIVKS